MVWLTCESHSQVKKLKYFATLKSLAHCKTICRVPYLLFCLEQLQVNKSAEFVSILTAGITVNSHNSCTFPYFIYFVYSSETKNYKGTGQNIDTFGYNEYNGRKLLTRLYV